MDPFLLGSGVDAQLTIESDWVEGCRPNQGTLVALADLAGKVRGKPVELIAGNEISRAAWTAASARALVERNVSPSASDAPRVYLLWAPSIHMQGNPFGAAQWLMVDSARGKMVVANLLLSADAIRSARISGLDPGEVERATVLHEYGHLVGLVGDRAHAQKDDPYHCRRGACVMPGPTRKMMASGAFRAVFLGKLPQHYCDDCWSDIRRAKAYYGAASSDPIAAADLEQRERWQRHWLAGRHRAAAGAWEDAAAELRAALSLSVATREYEDVGLAALQHGFPAIALSAATSARGAGHDSPILERVRDRGLIGVGRFTEAFASRDFLSRALALEASGQFELAARATHVGNSVTHRVLEASFLRRSGRPLRGIDVLRSLSAERGADPEVMLERGRCLRALGKEPAARITFQSAAAEAVRRAKGAKRSGYAERQRTAALAFALAGHAAPAEEAVRNLLERGWPVIALTTRSQVEAIRGDVRASIDTLDRMRREGYQPSADVCSHDDWSAARQVVTLPFCDARTKARNGSE